VPAGLSDRRAIFLDGSSGHARGGRVPGTKPGREQGGRREIGPDGRRVEPPQLESSPRILLYSPPMTLERRSKDRHEILGQIAGDVTIMQPMAVLEISTGGALIEVGVPLMLESLHDFRLTVGDHTVVVKARVAHCRVTEVELEHLVYRAGIEFVNVPPHAMEAIRSYIDVLTSARAGL
jgi:hypothetical protein